MLLLVTRGNNGISSSCIQYHAKRQSTRWKGVRGEPLTPSEPNPHDNPWGKRAESFVKAR